MRRSGIDPPDVYFNRSDMLYLNTLRLHSRFRTMAWSPALTGGVEAIGDSNEGGEHKDGNHPRTQERSDRHA